MCINHRIWLEDFVLSHRTIFFLFILQSLLTQSLTKLGRQTIMNRFRHAAFPMMLTLCYCLFYGQHVKNSRWKLFFKYIAALCYFCSYRRRENTMNAFLIKQQDAALLQTHSILLAKLIIIKVWFEEQIIWRTPVDRRFRHIVSTWHFPLH